MSRQCEHGNVKKEKKNVNPCPYVSVCVTICVDIQGIIILMVMILFVLVLNEIGVSASIIVSSHIITIVYDIKTNIITITVIKNSIMIIFVIIYWLSH